MLGNLAMRATAAVLGLGSMAAPCTTAGPARGLLQRAAAARPALPPCARCLFGAGWARGLAGNATQGQQAAPGSRVAAASYAYEAVAQDPAAAAEIAEIDFDASLVNTGEGIACRSVGPTASCLRTAHPAAQPTSPPRSARTHRCLLAAVRLIGTVGGKKDLKVFERSKLLPFAIGIKPDRRKPEEIEWWVLRGLCPSPAAGFANRPGKHCRLSLLVSCAATIIQTATHAAILGHCCVGMVACLSIMARIYPHPCISPPPCFTCPAAPACLPATVPATGSMLRCGVRWLSAQIRS